jgi:hypothetical protein
MDTRLSFFDRLLRTAAAQPQPQRLLFVFAQSELPTDATPAQRAAYEAGSGGALVPLACVDRSAAELSTFEALRAESHAACPPWQAVFVGAVDEGAPTSIDGALESMVENIRAGRLDGYLALDCEGAPLELRQGATAPSA